MSQTLVSVVTTTAGKHSEFVLKRHYATILAKMTSVVLAESCSDGSLRLSGSFGGCYDSPQRFWVEKRNMQLAATGPSSVRMRVGGSFPSPLENVVRL